MREGLVSVALTIRDCTTTLLLTADQAYSTLLNVMSILGIVIAIMGSSFLFLVVRSVAAAAAQVPPVLQRNVVKACQTVIAAGHVRQWPSRRGYRPRCTRRSRAWTCTMQPELSSLRAALAHHVVAQRRPRLHFALKQQLVRVLPARAR